MSGDCLFCKIVAKKIPAKLVKDAENWTSFEDIAPQAPTHILVIPKKHIANTADLNRKDRDLVGDLVLHAAKIAKERKLDESGYRLVINCNNEGGQTVPHLHIHLLGGRQMKWPPG